MQECKNVFSHVGILCVAAAVPVAAVDGRLQQAFHFLFADRVFDAIVSKPLTKGVDLTQKVAQSDVLSRLLSALAVVAIANASVDVQLPIVQNSGAQNVMKYVTELRHLALQDAAKYGRLIKGKQENVSVCMYIYISTHTFSFSFSLSLSLTHTHSPLSSAN